MNKLKTSFSYTREKQVQATEAPPDHTEDYQISLSNFLNFSMYAIHILREGRLRLKS